MKNSLLIFCFAFICLKVNAQSNSFNPYSRYGIGEPCQSTFAHNMAMGGAHVAWRPDSTSPTFVNTGNPASYPHIRLTTLEVGGRFISSNFSSASGVNVQKWGTNFAYASIAFPVKRNGGAAFGIMPYSSVGYETQSRETVEGIGNVLYNYTGTGGINKFFLGYGVMPLSKRLIKFHTKRLFIPDSLKTLSRGAYKRREVLNELLSDFSIGANANYMFGLIQNDSRVVYPNINLYNNTYMERDLTISDVTGNFGMQTALTVDSVRDPVRRAKRIDFEMRAFIDSTNRFTAEELQFKRDSLDSKMGTQYRALREKIKLTFGYFSSINNPMNVTYNSASYNYIINTSGQEILRDTALYNYNNHSTVSLPLETGFGMGFKKGEKINVVADFAITNWETFKYLGSPTDLVKNYRVSAGVNYVPEKNAVGLGTYPRTINYRLGASYQTGYVKVGDGTVSDYYVSAGLGIPVGVGRRSAMVNVSFQYGQMKAPSTQYVSETYYKIFFGFTLCDKWFQKFKYD